MTRYGEATLRAMLAVDLAQTPLPGKRFDMHGDIKKVKGRVYIFIEDYRCLISSPGPERMLIHKQSSVWDHEYNPDHSGWYPASFEGENI